MLRIGDSETGNSSSAASGKNSNISNRNASVALVESAPFGRTNRRFQFMNEPANVWLYENFVRMAFHVLELRKWEKVNPEHDSDHLDHRFSMAG